MSNPRSIERVLNLARQRLRAAGIGSAALDARLLLQAATGFSAEDLILHPEGAILPTAVARLEDMLALREKHQPVSRILGQREFYGRSFGLSPAVLDPRPDTEAVVELALEIMGSKPNVRFLDIGTGSGAIAVTLAAERSHWTGTALDVSSEALAVAESNAASLHVKERLEFVCANWFAPGEQKFDLIISNPPYIGSVEIAGLAPDVRLYDPVLALDGGHDGLQAYREIAKGAASRLLPEGLVVVEIGAGQERQVGGIFQDQGFGLLQSRPDLGGHVRGLAFRRAS